MKVAINKCYGGFSLSAKAVARIAELNGRPCYFFKQDIKSGLRVPYIPITQEKADHPSTFIFSAFSVPNPNEVLSSKGWHEMTDAEKKADSATYSEIELSNRDYERHDARLIQTIEELGDAANGSHAELRIVEIPDGVEYEISEYDGLEHIAEAHRTWG